MSITKRRYGSIDKLLHIRRSILELPKEQITEEHDIKIAQDIAGVLDGYPVPIDRKRISKVTGLPNSVLERVTNDRSHPAQNPSRQLPLSMGDALKVVNGLLADLNYTEPKDERSIQTPDGLSQNPNENINLAKLATSLEASGPTVHLLSAELVNQLDAFIEHLRTKNDIDPDLRSSLLEFFQKHRKNVAELALSIPSEHGPDTDEASETAGFLSEYLEHMRSYTSEYVSPESLAKITVPTGIVLLSGAVGTALGQPLIGFGFGAWLTGKLSPDKLATQILKEQNTPDG